MYRGTFAKVLRLRGIREGLACYRLFTIGLCSCEQATPPKCTTHASSNELSPGIEKRRIAQCSACLAVGDTLHHRKARGRMIAL